jgi:type VII secretion protein EccB
MVRQPATRLESSARRFHARRMMHALVRRDVAMHDDPLRAQSVSLAVGGVLAALAIVADAVVAVVSPRGVPSSAPIVIGRESGALYVRIGDTLHPVLNLASARLVARAAANPVPAGDASIARAKRGPLMGIPGAPATMGTPLRGQSWTVCDDDRTVVAVGDADPHELSDVGPVLVTPRGESAAASYLLYDGQRAAVDLRNRAVVRALRLDGVAPVPVSRALLDLVPEVPAIVAPRIAGFGEPGPPALGALTIGTVVQVRRADVADHYVVLRDGVQSIGDVLADLIRFTYDGRARRVAEIAPAAIAAVPIVSSLPGSTLPQHARSPAGAAEHPTVCARWRPRGSVAPSSNTVVLVGERPFREASHLAQADGAGPNVDAVLMPGGASAYVGSARIVGDDGRTGPRFLVTDAGVAFGVHDDDAAVSLGLGQTPEPAPWPILAHLPHGPELSTAAASVARDGLPTPS